jgi:hypothetical protein
MTCKYPDDSIQSLVGKWWEEDGSRDVRRGRLVRAFVPHVDQEPQVLVAEGRAAPTDHTRALFRLETFRISQPPPASSLPVAALPELPGERRFVYRGKVRPALVLSTGGADVPAVLRLGAARWQTAPTILVAPYYGADRDGERGGWKPEFVARIRRAEYPQFIWDSLPIGDVKESILRLDHIMPIGRHPNSFEVTAHRLTAEALSIVDEWIAWITAGTLAEDGVLYDIRRGLLELAAVS